MNDGDANGGRGSSSTHRDRTEDPLELLRRTEQRMREHQSTLTGLFDQIGHDCPNPEGCPQTAVCPCKHTGARMREYAKNHFGKLMLQLAGRVTAARVGMERQLAEKKVAFDPVPVYLHHNGKRKTREGG